MRLPRPILFRWSNSIENTKKLAKLHAILYLIPIPFLPRCDGLDIKFQCMLVSFGMRYALVAGYSMISHKKTAVIGIPNMGFYLRHMRSFCNALSTLFDLDVRLRLVNFYTCKSWTSHPLSDFTNSGFLYIWIFMQVINITLFKCFASLTPCDRERYKESTYLAVAR